VLLLIRIGKQPQKSKQLKEKEAHGFGQATAKSQETEGK